MVTHAVDFLDRVDRIIVMEKGRIIHQGHFDQLKHLEYFNTILEHMKQKNVKEDEKEEDKSNGKNGKKRNGSTTSRRSQRSNSYISHRGSTINKDENDEQIDIGWRSFIKYFFYSKWTVMMLFVVIIFILARRACNMLFSYYMLRWVKDISDTHSNDPELLTILIAATIGFGALAGISALMHILFTLTINVKLFRDMLKRLMHAPVNTYFDVTPSGVILNRFSKDLQQVEMVLGFLFRAQMLNYVSIVSGIVLAAYSVIWVLILVPVVFLSLVFCLRIYKKGLKEATRIESVTNSPILTHLGETSLGISTIRVYDKLEDFEQKQYLLQNQNAACLLIRRGIGGWFNCTTNFITVAFLSFTFIYCVFEKDQMDPILSGLMLIYLMEIQYEMIAVFR